MHTYADMPKDCFLLKQFVQIQQILIFYNQPYNFIGEKKKAALFKKKTLCTI